MNRADRRLARIYHRELAKQPWTPLEPKPLTLAEREWPESFGNFVDAFLNNVVSVQRYERATAWGTVQHLAVRRHDETEIQGWDLLQRVKNEIAGELAVALEVYPREEDVVDQAPMRHLFVLPEGFDLPLTIRGRWT